MRRFFSTAAKPKRFDYTLNPRHFPIIRPSLHTQTTNQTTQQQPIIRTKNAPQSSTRLSRLTNQPSNQSTHQSTHVFNPSNNRSSTHSNQSNFVKIVEVGPRDGLQNEKKTISPAVKSELIFRLVESGCSLIEAASFVSPKWVPQMADSLNVMKLVRQAIPKKSAPQVTEERGALMSSEIGMQYQSEASALSSTLDLTSVSLPIQRLPSDMVFQSIHPSPTSGFSPNARAFHTRPAKTTINQIPYPRFAALTPNMQGYNSALSSDIDEIAVFASASETFSHANINCSIAESIERFVPMIEQAKRDNIPVRGYVSCVIGCPYEGWIEPEAVHRVVRKLLDLGCYEISLGDTIGVGTPGSTSQLLSYLLNQGIRADQLAVHFHDTYGQAVSNIHCALEFGIRTLDSAVGGLGGCPYAAGASGNVATEDVVYSLESSGYSTGIDLVRCIETAHWISGQLGKEPSSKVAKAVKASQEAACA